MKRTMIEKAKNILVEKITSLQGCKGTQLAGEEDIVLGLEGFDIPELLEELVKEGSIIEIEYILPTIDWRVKSFYLPSGTKIKVFEKGR